MRSTVDVFFNKSNLIIVILLAINITTCSYLYFIHFKTPENPLIGIEFDKELSSKDEEAKDNFLSLYILKRNAYEDLSKVNYEKRMSVIAISTFLTILLLILMIYISRLKPKTREVTIERVAQYFAHDLLNELNVATIAFSVIKKNSELSNMRIVNNAEQSIQHCVSTIKHLLAYSDKREIEVEKLNLSMILNENFEHYREEYPDIQFDFDIKSDMYFNGDKSSTDAMIKTIINNALDVVPDNGEIKLQSQVLNSTIEVSIEDNGPGMSKEIMKKIFEPSFSHGKVNGNGLGLASASWAMSKINGKISVEQVPKSGARFTIKIPQTKEKV